MPKVKFDLQKYKSPYYNGVATLFWKIPIAFRHHPEVTQVIETRNCRINYSRHIGNNDHVYARRAVATHFTVLEKTDSQL